MDTKTSEYQRQNISFSKPLEFDSMMKQADISVDSDYEFWSNTVFALVWVKLWPIDIWEEN